MAMLLEKELELYGCEVAANEFNELLADLHIQMHPSWTTEQLLYRPSYGITFVNAVRSKTRCHGLPEEMVLRRLQNLRKNTDFGEPRP
jgi:hypothetical protein